MATTFTVTGSLKDFGKQPRVGVTVQAVAEPEVKIGDDAVYSNAFEFEPAVTIGDGTFSLQLVSLVGLVYTIDTPYDGAINPVRLYAYVPDVDDPTTGVEFPEGTTIDIRTVVDENPTPSYQAIVINYGGAGGTSVHGDLTGRGAADQHPIGAITGLQDALDALAGGGGGLSVVDNGDGTLTLDGTAVVDKLDGTLTIGA